MRLAPRTLPLLAVLVSAAVCAPPAFATATGFPLGSLISKTLVSKRTLRPGVAFLHYHAAVSGLPTQQVYEVRWKLGNSHVRLRSRMLGTYHPSNFAMDIHQISRWAHAAGSPRLVTMLNGDFFRYTANWSAITSSMFASDRTIYNFGWPKFGGGPATGFMKSGRMVMGMPIAPPTRLFLPGGHTVTVQRWNAVPSLTPTDQVAVYTHAGSTVTIPSGYAAAVVHQSPFRHAFQGTKHWANPTGRNVNETVRSFSIRPSETAATVASVPISAPASSASATVPYKGAVLLFPATGMAAKGFAALLATPTPTVKVTVNDPAWNAVTEIMGGKPQVVEHGIPLTTRPAYVTQDQWAAEQWRPALATTADGHGMMVAIGAGGGRTSTSGSQFARLLAQLGAREAMQFDNRSSTELFASTFTTGTCAGGRSGACYTQYTGYERDIPVATGLYYTP